MQNIWMEYKVFELKYGNAQLSDVHVRLILSVFASTYLH